MLLGSPPKYQRAIHTAEISYFSLRQVFLVRISPYPPETGADRSGTNSNTVLVSGHDYRFIYDICEEFHSTHIAHEGSTCNCSRSGILQTISCAVNTACSYIV